MRPMEILGLEIKRFIDRGERDAADRDAIQAAGYKMPTVGDMERTPLKAFSPQGHAALTRRYQQRMRSGRLIRLRR